MVNADPERSISSGNQICIASRVAGIITEEYPKCNMRIGKCQLIIVGYCYSALSVEMSGCPPSWQSKGCSAIVYSVIPMPRIVNYGISIICSPVVMYKLVCICMRIANQTY